MKSTLFTVGILLLSLSSLSAGLGEEKPTKSGTPLSADEIAIYRAILSEYASSYRLDVSDTTFPLTSGPGPKLGPHDECFKDIPEENLASALHSFHNLTPEVLPRPKSENLRLVGPKQLDESTKTAPQGKSIGGAIKNAPGPGTFSMSEIAFDKEHRHAVVSYTMWCGSLCGDGATLVFEKTDGVWKKTNRRCGHWVS